MNEALLLKLDDYGKLYQRLSHRENRSKTLENIHQRLSGRIISGCGIVLDSIGKEEFNGLHILDELGKLHNRVESVSSRYEENQNHKKVVGSIEKVILEVLENT